MLEFIEAFKALPAFGVTSFFLQSRVRSFYQMFPLIFIDHKK